MLIGIDHWSFHNALFFGRMPPEEFIDKAAELGADGVGLDYFMLPGRLRRDPAPLKERLDVHEMRLVFGFGMPFVLPDAAFYLMDRHRRRAFELAHQLKADVLRVAAGLVLPVPGLRPLHLSLSRRAEPAWVASRLGHLCREARAEGLTLALENRSDYTSRQILEIIERVDSEALRVTLDTGNSASLGEDPYEAAARLAPHAAHAHIKDARGRGLRWRAAPPGEGELDIPRMIDILRTADYGGLYAIETDLPPWRRAEEEGQAARAISYLRGLDRDGVH